MDALLEALAAHSAALLILLSLAVCGYALYRWLKGSPDDEEDKEP